MHKKYKFITKSDITRGLQCLKLAHSHRFRPELADPLDPYQQLLINRGHHVQEIAQKEFKSATARLLFAEGDNLEDAALKTQLVLNDSRVETLFEATFCSEDLLVRCDILYRKAGEAGWHLVEVKSGGDLDREYVQDAAIQVWVLKKLNIQINSVSVWYVNKKCELPNLEKLFVKENISERCNEHFTEIEGVVNNLRKIFSNPNLVPMATIGGQCNKPFACPFQGLCHQTEAKIPELSVFNIPRIGARAWDLYSEGIVKIEDIDTTKLKFTANQLRMIEATQTKKMYLNQAGIKASLADWKFPLYMLDFEAMDYDLPGLPHTLPGIHTAFQVSIHRVDAVDKPIVKVGDYLHENRGDPRAGLANFLAQNIGPVGSIVAYSQSYEKGKLVNMSSVVDSPVKEQLIAFTERLVDPLPIFRDNVYHHEFAGSFSIKKVAPALLGPDSSYEHLPVKDGTEAVVAFRKMITEEEPEVREQLKQDLIKYCDQDTLVMAKLVLWLFKNQAA